MILSGNTFFTVCELMAAYERYQPSEGITRTRLADPSGYFIGKDQTEDFVREKPTGVALGVTFH